MTEAVLRSKLKRLSDRLTKIERIASSDAETFQRDELSRDACAFYCHGMRAPFTWC